MQNLNLDKIKYILFDWDNTLAATHEVLTQVINLVLQEHHLPAFEQMSSKMDRDISFRDNFATFFGAEKATQAYERYCELYYQKAPALLHTFPGIVEILDFLRRRHIPLIILSNKDRRLLEFDLPRLFNPSWFSRIVCGHEAPLDKPYPEQLFYALRGWLEPSQINRSNVWMIGDSPQDSRCALAAGALPIRVGKTMWNDNDENRDGIVFFDDFITFKKLLLSL